MLIIPNLSFRPDRDWVSSAATQTAMLVSAFLLSHRLLLVNSWSSPFVASWVLVPNGVKLALFLFSFVLHWTLSALMFPQSVLLGVFIIPPSIRSWIVAVWERLPWSNATIFFSIFWLFCCGRDLTFSILCSFYSSHWLVVGVTFSLSKSSGILHFLFHFPSFPLLIDSTCPFDYQHNNPQFFMGHFHLHLLVLHMYSMRSFAWCVFKLQCPLFFFQCCHVLILFCCRLAS